MYYRGALQKAVQEAVCLKVYQHRARDLANAARSPGRLKTMESQLLASVTAHALPKIQQCLPQELSNLAWATATPQTLGSMSTDAAAAEGTQKVVGSSVQNLANAAQGSSAEAASAETLKRISQPEPQAPTNTVRSPGTLGVSDVVSLEAAATQGRHKAEMHCPQDLKFGHQSVALPDIGNTSRASGKPSHLGAPWPK
eukprot:s55_g11.t1